MSLRSKLTAAVDNAFAAAGDLVKTATLSNKTVSGYDFNTSATTSTTVAQSVQIILLSTKNSSGTGFNTSAIMKSGVDLDVYDTLTVDAIEYRITDFSDNDFAIEATLVREK
jgi:hypothetical protein